MLGNPGSKRQMFNRTAEVVQRALKTLEHAGVIQMTRARIRILDVDALGVWIDSEHAIAAPRARSSS
jgi:hypothetical protein